MYVLFTDFGEQGPYVGQLKAVLAERTPATPIIDLLHHAPAMDPRAAAYLLEPFTKDLPAGTVIIAVVDPGVGSERPGCVVEADGRWFVGPDNGLFEFVMTRAGEARYWRLPPAPPGAAATFHGRDVFAPTAVRLAEGEHPEDGPHDPVAAGVVRDWPEDTPYVLYTDHYGNAMTGIRGETLSDAAVLLAGEERLERARTFSEVPPGEAFWYRNSSGLVEVAVNGGRADDVLGLEPGRSLRLSRP